MKTKISILIAASLCIALITEAQYGTPYVNNRVVIQGQFVVPGGTVVAYDYNHTDREQYHGYDDRRDNHYDRYEDHRDWKAAEYDRYCRETRGYRMCREEFYRTHCNYRVAPYCAPRRVIVYR